MCLGVKGLGVCGASWLCYNQNVKLKTETLSVRKIFKPGIFADFFFGFVCKNIPQLHLTARPLTLLRN